MTCSWTSSSLLQGSTVVRCYRGPPLVFFTSMTRLAHAAGPIAMVRDPTKVIRVRGTVTGIDDIHVYNAVGKMVRFARWLGSRFGALSLCLFSEKKEAQHNRYL